MILSPICQLGLLVLMTDRKVWAWLIVLIISLPSWIVAFSITSSALISSWAPQLAVASSACILLALCVCLLEAQNSENKTMLAVSFLTKVNEYSPQISTLSFAFAFGAVPWVGLVSTWNALNDTTAAFILLNVCSCLVSLFTTKFFSSETNPLLNLVFLCVCSLFSWAAFGLSVSTLPLILPTFQSFQFAAFLLTSAVLCTLHALAFRPSKGIEFDNMLREILSDLALGVTMGSLVIFQVNSTNNALITSAQGCQATAVTVLLVGRLNLFYYQQKFLAFSLVSASASSLIAMSVTITNLNGSFDQAAGFMLFAFLLSGAAGLVHIYSISCNYRPVDFEQVQIKSLHLQVELEKLKIERAKLEMDLV